jgi:hypothetical protein
VFPHPSEPRAGRNGALGKRRGVARDSRCGFSRDVVDCSRDPREEVAKRAIAAGERRA